MLAEFCAAAVTNKIPTTARATLLADELRVKALIEALHRAPLEHHKAKDILRAAGLPILSVGNPHVASDLAKIKDGVTLSPILLVRGDFVTGKALQIADGYHRVCASFHTDENTDIPCRTVAADAQG